MPLKPHCSKPEWMDRAGRKLMDLQPSMNAVDAARIVIEHLWEEACDLSPEEAARIYIEHQDVE